jgi:hypothetical protein
MGLRNRRCPSLMNHYAKTDAHEGNTCHEAEGKKETQLDCNIAWFLFFHCWIPLKPKSYKKQP